MFSPPSLFFSNVLPISLRALHSHPVLSFVLAKYLLMSMPIITNYIFSFIQVWDPSAVNIADYIRIRTGHGLTPTKATLLLGMVQQFSSSVISKGIYRR